MSPLTWSGGWGHLAWGRAAACPVPQASTRHRAARRQQHRAARRQERQQHHRRRPHLAAASLALAGAAGADQADAAPAGPRVGAEVEPRKVALDVGVDVVKAAGQAAVQGWGRGGGFGVWGLGLWQLELASPKPQARAQYTGAGLGLCWAGGCSCAGRVGSVEAWAWVCSRTCACGKGIACLAWGKAASQTAVLRQVLTGMQGSAWRGGAGRGARRGGDGCNKGLEALARLESEQSSTPPRWPT